VGARGCAGGCAEEARRGSRRPCVGDARAYWQRPFVPCQTAECCGIPVDCLARVSPCPSQCGQFACAGSPTRFGRAALYTAAISCCVRYDRWCPPSLSWLAVAGCCDLRGTSRYNCSRVIRKPARPWVAISRSQDKNSPSDSWYRRQASSRPMTPLRTASTTAALRRGTQRFVSGGGKQTTLELAGGNVSSPVKSFIFHSRASGRISFKLGRHVETATSGLFQAVMPTESAPLSGEHFWRSLSQSLVQEIVSGKFREPSN